MSDRASLLAPEQFERYRRHLGLSQFGVEGQQRLRQSRVLLVGAGGLGCPAAQYLVAAGLGALDIVDDDVVDLSNLQRQVLYATDDVGRPKVEVATERLRALNPEVEIRGHQRRLTSEGALELVREVDLVLDGRTIFQRGT